MTKTIKAAAITAALCLPSVAAMANHTPVGPVQIKYVSSTWNDIGKNFCGAFETTTGKWYLLYPITSTQVGAWMNMLAETIGTGIPVSFFDEAPIPADTCHTDPLGHELHYIYSPAVGNP